MPDLVMMVPSRGRPDSIARLCDEFIMTCTAVTELRVFVDDDDPQLDGYVDLLLPHLDVRPRTRIGPLLNAVAPAIATESYAVGFMGDDHSPMTIGWDTRFLDALHALGTGVVYGNDTHHGEALPTAVAMTSDIVRTLGYFVPPGLIHLFFDNAWLAIGRGLDRITYLDDVVLAHRHPNYGEVAMDQTYAEANSSETWQHDEAGFNAYMATTFPSDIEKLRALL
jgi:hypothetical protein